MGSPIDFKSRCSIETWEKELFNLILNCTKHLVVKIVGFKTEHQEKSKDDPFAEGLEPVVCLNGFFYSDSDALILTCTHALSCGATCFYALFNDGANSNAIHPLELVNSSLMQGPAHGNAGVGWVDVVVFRCPQHPVRPPRLHGACAAPGEKACVIGFAGQDAAQLSYSVGTISRVALESFKIEAYAESCYFGSPILNIDGFLIGMAKCTENCPDGSCSPMEVTAVPAQNINLFLLYAEPRLPELTEYAAPGMLSS